MIKVKDYHHVAVVVRDLEKAAWFCGDALGLPNIERPSFPFPGRWYQVGTGRQLHLTVIEEEIPRTMRHIALEVEDFRKAQEDLKNKEIEIIDGPGKRPDGSDYLFCLDPDANRVEITKH